MFQGKIKPASNNLISPLLICQPGEEDPPSRPSHFGNPLCPNCHRNFLWATHIKNCRYLVAIKQECAVRHVCKALYGERK